MTDEKTTKKTTQKNTTKKTTTKSAAENNRPATGRGGKYNFPNARLKLIEQDDDKRKFLAKAIHNNLEFFNVGLNPVKSDEELCERLNWYFARCEETQQLPTVEKMANCIGYHRSTLHDWMNKRRQGFSVATADIIKKAFQILAALDAELAQEGKIQPVVYFFRSKNFYGMKDQQDVVVTAASDDVKPTAEELKKRISETVIDISGDVE